MSRINLLRPDVAVFRCIHSLVSGCIKVFCVPVIFLLMVGITLYELQNVEQGIRNQSVKNLKTALDATYDVVVNNWSKNAFKNTSSWAADKILIESAQELLIAFENQKNLAEQPAQKNLQKFFLNHLQHHQITDFKLIAKNLMILASADLKDIAQSAVLSEENRKHLNGVFSGEKQLIKIEGSESTFQQRKPSFFVTVPVKDKNDDVIAAFALQISPLKQFNYIAYAERIGQSGEVYLFDKSGLLASESRFTDQLRVLGLIEQDEMSAFNFIVADPGGNLLSGYKRITPIEDWPMTKMLEQALNNGR
ncbi:MAG: hypothetical protein GQ532_00310 [Methylomarinum sp.]|nr:hypothetical protein [Methylomarinum sp.]